MRLHTIILVIVYLVVKKIIPAEAERGIIFPNIANRFSESNDKIIVCYYASWEIWKVNETDRPSFISSNIDSNLCTHLIHAFAKVLKDGTVQEGDPWADKEYVDENTGLGNSPYIQHNIE